MLAFHSAPRAAVAAAVVLITTACGRKPAAPQRPAVPVTVGAARFADVPYTLSANGVVTPIQTAAITPQVDGIITDVAFREGQDVARGDVLFRIEPRPYKAAFDQARAALTRDSAAAENARREADRYESLVAQDYVTREQADQMRATATSAIAVVDADRAALEAAQFNLANTTIRAPISGRTGSVLIRVGNVVHAAGSVPLLVIDQVAPILVRFAVPGSTLPLVRQYSATGALPVLAEPSAGPRQEGSGSTTASGDSAVSNGGSSDDPPASAGAAVPSSQGALTFIDNAIDTTTGTVMLKATFANSDALLWPGEFVAVSLRLFIEQNALVVPSTAVETGQQGTYVYTVDSTGTAQQRRVGVERTADGLSVIRHGLAKGEIVVTDGQSRLTPGARVTTSARTAPQGPDSTAGNHPAPSHRRG